MFLFLPCNCMSVDSGDERDEARYSESEKMYHSLTGREQSPVRRTPYNQWLFVRAERGREQLISLDAQL